MKIFNLLAVASLLLLGAGCQTSPNFKHDVSTTAKPWTHLNFHNDPNSFQFAVVTDRTGGHRPGIFESAVDKLNLMRPEFVMSVGDFIEGYTEDEKVLRVQWEEFNGFVRRFKMPFFYVPGNHDVTNPKMVKMYEEQFGRRYFSFVYRDVLFLCLDSQDGGGKPDGFLSETQIEWAREVLRKNPSVRWTLLFMHQPLWLYDERATALVPDKNRAAAESGKVTGFKKIEEALQGREYTVFVGHFHRYTKYVRHDKRYIVMGSTGGASQLRGTSFGEFDHASWVTMTPKGPEVANLLLDGIRDEDVYTEKHARFQSQLVFSEVSGDAKGLSFAFKLQNPFRHDLRAELLWQTASDSGWKLEPADADMVIRRNTEHIFNFKAQYTGEETYPVMPTMRARLNAGHDYNAEHLLRVPLNVDAYLAANRAKVAARQTAAAPKVDGKLDDDAWKDLPQVSKFRSYRLQQEPTVKTQTWLAYDDTHLYVAFRCDDPAMGKVRATITKRDGEIYNDDSVDVMINTSGDPKKYFHFIVNANGTIYDALGQDAKAFDSNASIAVGKEEKAWTVEMAIPWKDLQIEAPKKGTELGLQLARVRWLSRELLQFPPLNGNNHRGELHGRLGF